MVLSAVMCLDEKSFPTTRVCILSSKKIPEGVRLAVDRVLVLILGTRVLI